MLLDLQVIVQQLQQTAFLKVVQSFALHPTVCFSTEMIGRNTGILGCAAVQAILYYTLVLFIDSIIIQ